ncbi:MAG: hypothetical protein U0798_17590 [Gemmataceae bacterium]
MERNKEREARLNVRYGHELAMFDTQSDVDRRMANAAARREAIERTPIPLMQTFDRSTATGQRLTREAAVVHEAQARQKLAERDLIASTKDRIVLEQKSVAINEERRKLTIEVASKG